MKKHIFFIFLLILTIFLTTSCTSKTNYSGKGVTIQILNKDLKEIYYYGQEETYDLEVELHNVGQSLTKGVLYISGFNPQILEINRSMPLSQNEEVKTCYVKINSLSMRPSFEIYCDNFGARITRGSGGGFNIDFSKTNLELFNKFNIPNLDIDIGVDRNGNIETGNIRIGGQTFGLECEYKDGRVSCNGNIEFEENKERPYIPGAAFLAYFNSLVNLTRLDRGYEFALLGNSQYYPGGERTTITVPIKVKSMPKNSDKVKQELVLTLLYPYTTYVAVPICLSTKSILDSEAKNSCLPKTTYVVKDKSNAPLIVTKIMQKNIGNKIIFEIYVKNIGQGKIWDWTKAELIEPYVPLTQEIGEAKNVVYVGHITVGNLDKEVLNCFTPGEESFEINSKKISTYKIRLSPTKQESSFVCVLDLEKAGLNNLSPFNTVLNLELWYLYQQDIKVPLEIYKVE